MELRVAGTAFSDRSSAARNTEMLNAVLRKRSPEFDKIYAVAGRPSILPERLLRHCLLQVLYTIRIERMLKE